MITVTGGRPHPRYDCCFPVRNRTFPIHVYISFFAWTIHSHKKVEGYPKNATPVTRPPKKNKRRSLNRAVTPFRSLMICCRLVLSFPQDTMAYTASALSFMLENLDKPVILTGTLRGWWGDGVHLQFSGALWCNTF